MKDLLLSALLLQEEEERSVGLFGLPVIAWQLANLIGFLAVLFYFVARPLTNLFRQRQLDVERRLKEAQDQRTEAARLETEIHERMARLDQELAEIRARGVAQGEEARVELLRRAEQDAEAVRRQAEEEIGRRLESAKQMLRATVAQLTATAAHDLLSAQVTPEDQRRLFAESVERLEREP